jgi:hypothetical protein
MSNKTSPWQCVLKKINKREENDNENVEVCRLSINRRTTSTQQSNWVSEQENIFFQSSSSKITSEDFSFVRIQLLLLILFSSSIIILDSIWYLKSNLRSSSRTTNDGDGDDGCECFHRDHLSNTRSNKSTFN